MMTRILMVLMVVLTITSCSKESIRGTGSVVSEIRTVNPFSAVELEGEAEVNIVQGATQKVEVTGYQNLVPIYETYVHNGSLVLKFKSNYYNVRNNNIKVNVIIPALSRVGLDGSGDILIKNFSEVELSADLNGSGDIITNNCTYDKTNLRVNGSGFIGGFQIQAKETDAEVNGSGQIDVSCSQELKATIRGSGRINYKGNPPTISVNISGSGSVNKR